MLFAAAFSLVCASAFHSYADITSDMPQLSDSPTFSDLPVLYSDTKGSSGVIITDDPILGGDTSSSNIIPIDPGKTGTANNTENPSADSARQETASAQQETTSAQQESVSARQESSGVQQETQPPDKDDTELSDKPSVSGSAEGGVIDSAPETGATSKTYEAPKAESKNSEAGSVHSNDAVSRINLDFSLVTPNHVKGNLRVARGCVQLTSGSWQTFDYKDNIHYAFFKLKETKTDSSGTTWHIVDVKARRFGDAATEDGEYKSELWLNAADCITRNFIDINTTNAKRIAVVKAALSLLGKKYTYGANGPDAYDCSGLVKYVFAQAGISVPRTSTQLLQLSGQITAGELRPGDIMVRAGHCGIYIGNGIFVHASDSSVGVVAEYLSVYNLSNKFTNYINVVGD